MTKAKSAITKERTKERTSSDNNTSSMAANAENVKVKARKATSKSSSTVNATAIQDSAKVKTKLTKKSHSAEPQTEKPNSPRKIIIQRLDIFLDYEHRILPSVPISAAELPKLSSAQAQRVKSITEDEKFQEILKFTPAAVNLPVPESFLTNPEKIKDSLKSALIDFLHAQDEVLIHAVRIYQDGNISPSTAESLKKYRLLKRKNVSKLYNSAISWGHYNQRINSDLNLVKSK